jgi:hypothetical protein
METEPSPGALARREEVELMIGRISAMAAQENNVYLTKEIEAIGDELLDRFNLIGELY